MLVRCGRQKKRGDKDAIEKDSQCSSSQRTLYRKQIQPRGDLSQIEIVLTVYWSVETNDSKSERIVLKTEGLNKRIQILYLYGIE